MEDGFLFQSFVKQDLTVSKRVSVPQRCMRNISRFSKLPGRRDLCCFDWPE
jgi:hypothetical protein